MKLTHWDRVTHIYVSKLAIIGWDNGIALSAPSHYLNQCWNIVNFNIRNTFQWNLKRNSCIFIQEKAFENVVFEMVVTLSRPECVKVHLHIANSNDVLAVPWNERWIIIFFQFYETFHQYSITLSTHTVLAFHVPVLYMYGATNWPSSRIIMTSSNGNIFRVTGHLCGKSPGHRWIPRT